MWIPSGDKTERCGASGQLDSCVVPVDQGLPKEILIA